MSNSCCKGESLVKSQVRSLIKFFSFMIVWKSVFDWTLSAVNLSLLSLASAINFSWFSRNLENYAFHCSNCIVLFLPSGWPFAFPNNGDLSWELWSLLGLDSEWLILLALFCCVNMKLFRFFHFGREERISKHSWNLNGWPYCSW